MLWSGLSGLDRVVWSTSHRTSSPVRAPSLWAGLLSRKRQTSCLVKTKQLERSFSATNLFCSDLVEQVNFADWHLLSTGAGMLFIVLHWNPIIVIKCNTTRYLTLRRIKRCSRTCIHHANTTASFHCQLVGDIVFKLNPDL